jgi:hypothetical protein
VLRSIPTCFHSTSLARYPSCPCRTESEGLQSLSICSPQRYRGRLVQRLLLCGWRWIPRGCALPHPQRTLKQCEGCEHQAIWNVHTGGSDIAEGSRGCFVRLVSGSWHGWIDLVSDHVIGSIQSIHMPLRHIYDENSSTSRHTHMLNLCLPCSAS